MREREGTQMPLGDETPSPTEAGAHARDRER
jgi:hypothetical protein